MPQSIFQNPRKHIAIFGAGRTGLGISEQLAKMGVCIDLFDTHSKKEISNTQNIKIHKISENPKLARLMLSHIMEQNYIKNFDSIFHTFLYTAHDFRNFTEITSGFTNHLGTIGTILTFDRQLDRGVLDETKPKISTDNIWINGGYTQGKRELELAIERFQTHNPHIKFFLPKTFHILGEGWVPGICPPHFRDLNLINQLQSGEIYLPMYGDILYQIIDISDLSKYIALGILKQLHGDYIIVNPKIITAREYYENLTFILGSQIDILEKPISQIFDTKIMLLDWVCSVDRLQKALGFELVFESHDKTLRDSLAFLIRQESSGSTSLKHSEIWERMNKGQAPCISKMQAKIHQARIAHPLNDI